jgi:hypothetical protein
MAYLDEKLFFAGLNTDDEDRGLENGDYRHALNTEISGYLNAAVGVAEKDRGNNQVLYTLPAGTNTCIGSCRDEIGNRIYFFIHNSNGNHGIYEYNRVDRVVYEVFIGSILGFSLASRINHCNVVNGKLLYWTDGDNPPRKINIEKAKPYNKKRTYNINFGDQCATGETYSFQVYNPSGVLVETFATTVAGTGGTAYVVAKAIVAQYSSAYVTLTTCGPTVEAEMINVGAYTLQCTAYSNGFVLLPNQVITVANNFYPTPYVEDFIDRLKYPPHCEPTAEYKYDPSRGVSLVEDRVFQFAVRYIYDDYEKSTLSPHSLIPTYNSGCSATASSGNYIQVDFTEARLNDPDIRSIIKKVDILFKERNDGIWKIAQTLEPDQFGINTNIFNFYNDSVYAAIDINESVKLYDAVPIKCGASEFIGNRIFDADITENYDNVCVDANIDVSYQNANSTGVTIKGLLSVITNRRSTADPMSPLLGIFREPIYKFEQATGTSKNGYGFNLAYNGPFGFNPFNDYEVVAIDQYKQNLGLDGFVVYLAGTDYYGTSTQKPAVGFGGYQDPATGVVSIDKNRRGVNNQWDDALKIVSYTSTGGQFQSEWFIQGVNPGRYSLRVASHLTTGADIAAGKEIYQKTSTTVMPGSYGGTLLGVANTGQFEAIVDVNANGSVDIYDPFSLTLLYSSPTGDCGETFICDPAYVKQEINFITPPSTVPGYVYAGYYVDGEQASLPTTLQDGLAETRIPYAGIEAYQIGVPGFSSDYPTFGVADHNGFFYLAAQVASSIYINKTRIGTNTYDNPGILNGTLPSNAVYFYDTFPALNGNRTTAGATYVVIRLNDPTSTQDRRTHITGTIVDQYGNALEGVNVVLATGVFAETDALGQFDIITYLENGVSPTVFRVLLLSTSNYNCLYTISQNQFPYSFDISAGAFNNTNPFAITPSFQITVSMQPYNSSFKRGFDGTFGIVYYDRGNRSGTVNTIDPLQLHIPYYTEKDPVTGLVPTGDIPVLTWTISSPPPDWATHYQWVRTKNLQVSFFIEWAADSIEYVNEALSTAPTVNATQAKLVRISYANLLFYQQQNADSILAYTYQAGDRIRFRSTPNGNYFTQYLDYKITGIDTGYLFIENDSFLSSLASGTIVEIYRSNLITEEKLYYEFGECYEVYELNGVKYHAGPLQNQTSTQNARGVFKSGDVWYRRRAIPYDTTTSPQQVITYISDPNISDFYVSNDQNIGRINIENRNTRQIRRERSVRFSEPYVIESYINGLSTFNALDVTSIDKGEGPINKLQKSGRVLLTLQQSQVNSLYINEIIYIDATGSNTLTVSDKVIGSKTPLAGLYGTVNPESVAEYEGRVYFFDKTAGAVLRYAPDGLTPVSFYKFRKGIQQKASEMSSFASDKTLAIAGFDPMMRKYIVSFQKTDQNISFQDETVSFSEPLNRWISYYSYTPEEIQCVGIEMITFKEGELWVHDGPGYANYYGTQYPNQVTVVSNLNSDKVRNFRALATESSHAFHMPVITVPIDGTQMMTRILPNKDRYVEGVYYYVIPKDMTSPNFPSQADAIVNGRDMRGHVISVTLQNDMANQVRLYAMNVRYIASEYSKK